MKVTEEQFMVLTDCARVKAMMALIRESYIHDIDAQTEISKAFNILYEIDRELRVKYEISD